MLAMADRDGIVYASVPGLSDRARVSIESTLLALEKLKSPDEWSRTKDHEGRRIVDVDGGWKLLNYEKYRNKSTAEQVRAKTAERVARYRERNAVTRNVTGVTLGNPIAEAEAEAYKKLTQRKSRTEKALEELAKEMS